MINCSHPGFSSLYSKVSVPLTLDFIGYNLPQWQLSFVLCLVWETYKFWDEELRNLNLQQNHPLQFIT